MRFSKSSIFPFVLVFSFFVLAVSGYSSDIVTLEGPEHHAPDRDFDVIHYTLHLSFDASAETVFGREIIVFSPFQSGLDSIVLDAAKMEIKSVQLLSKKKLSFQKYPEKLAIYLDKKYAPADTISISIIYQATNPENGLYFINQQADGKEHFEIYSQGEEEENHFWFPCWDFPNDRATSEVFATTKIPNIVISNGRLVDVTTNKKDSTKTFHWKMDIPHASYLISIIVGNYLKVEDHYKNVAVQYYVHPDQRQNAMATFSKTPQIIGFFSNKIGIEYPYSKYAQTVVDNFKYGGMENITATTLTSSTIRDARSNIDGTAEGLIAHELAHQWWGDLLTCRDWTNSWLNEGFATYFASLWTEYSRGEDAFDYTMQRAGQIYMSEDSTRYRRTLAWYKYKNPMNMFDRHAYQKGACVLHMLRYVLGDELFWKGINYYGRTNALKLVEASDLKKAFEEATGKNLYWFFDEWVYSAGYPKYHVEKTWVDSLQSVALHVTQQQVGEKLTTVFRMPVKIEMFAGEKHRVATVDISTADTTIYLKCASNPDLVLFDPGNHILKGIEFKKSKKELLLQLAHASHAVDRLDALDQLSENFKDDVEVQKAIAEKSLSDSFWVVRRQAVNFLADVHPDWAEAILKKVAKDPKSRVRAAAISGFANYEDSSLVSILQNKIESDSSYSVISAALKTISKLDSAKAVSLLKQALNIDSFNENIRAAAVNALARFKLPALADTILAFGGAQYPTGLRSAVTRAVAKLAPKNPKVLAYLIGNLNDSSRWIKIQTCSALRKIGDPAAIEPLKKAIEKEQNPRLKKTMERTLKRLQEKAAEKDKG
ncbi:MAG: hypothetical protein GXO74_09645 [Calditrichaeota bacterium]|nr:hypothetical protein [Calditrichota bacterium]